MGPLPAHTTWPILYRATPAAQFAPCSPARFQSVSCCCCAPRPALARPPGITNPTSQLTLPGRLGGLPRQGCRPRRCCRRTRHTGRYLSAPLGTTTSKGDRCCSPLPARYPRPQHSISCRIIIRHRYMTDPCRYCLAVCISCTVFAGLVHDSRPGAYLTPYTHPRLVPRARVGLAPASRPMPV